MLLETACAETALGKYADPTPNGAGHGLCQFDQIGFDDVKARTRQKDKNLIYVGFGYDINNCQLSDLDNDPLLSFIFCRLKFKLRPEPIPKTVEGRARYWKQFYNTEAGKGTVEHYLESARIHLYSGELPCH